MRHYLTRFSRRLASDLALQVAGRKHLFSVMNDRRAFSLRSERDLMLAAMAWAKVLPFRPESIVDAGAYQGDVSAQLSVLYRPECMVLVEPFADLAQSLEWRNFAPRQRVYNCALGREDGTGMFNVISSRHSSSLLEISKEAGALFNMPMDNVETIEIPVRTLDGIVGESGLDRLDLLKVDVQGYELEVFAGGVVTLNRTRMFVCEVAFFEHYAGQPLFGDIYDFMCDAGFALSDLFGQIYDSHGVPLQADALFINRRLAAKVARAN
jgi:FkbM family methyltransferase